MPPASTARRAAPLSPRSAPPAASPADTAPYAVGFYLVPDFPLMAFAAAIEPLRAANRLAGRKLFAWRLYSRDGASVRASNGIDIAVDAALTAEERVPMLLACAGTAGVGTGDRAVGKALRNLVRNGCAIGGISLGAYVLARAGLLDGRRCALHWENLAAFAEQFPRIRTTTDIFVVDGNRCTCSGGTAALDMMLQVIAARHGPALATAVSEQFIHPRIRGAHDPQRMALQSRLGVANARLIAAVGIMESAIEEPREIRDIAAAVDVSCRQLERLFARHLQRHPRVYYLELRLDRARALLRQTTRPIMDIAVACGFASASHFGRCYRVAYGCRPSDERAPANYSLFA
jgi:transcriptional regulator GlxA family with amidase domain